MNLVINREEAVPIYKQIVRQIRDQILTGNLPAGFRLPPERRLAAALGITRTTVVSAYEELKSQGLVDARVGSGTLVLPAKNPPPEELHPRAFTWAHHFRDESLRPADPLVRDLLEMSVRPDVISFAIGLPSPSLLPLDAMQAHLAAAVAEGGAQVLMQTPTEGHPPLRDSLGRWLATRGIKAGAEEVLILSGSQQGLHLAARVFLNPGDIVIVESPTYFGAMEVFRRAGARILSVPVDAEGMQVDLLAGLLRHQRPRLIYTLPTFQNPTGAVLSLERRRALLALASSYGIPVLEDDTYTELRYDGPAIPSLKAMDTSGLVLSLGTFSKILFPGLRLGWLAASREVVHQFALAKQSTDLHAGTPGQWIMDRLIRQHELSAHLDRIRRFYREQRDAMEDALQAHAVEGMRWRKPEGGFYHWVMLPPGVDRARLGSMAADQGVNFLPGSTCFAEEPPAYYVRLSFSYPSRTVIREGVERFVHAVQYSVTGQGRGHRRQPQTLRPII